MVNSQTNAADSQIETSNPQSVALDWLLKLFSKSVLKQNKFAAISAPLGSLDGKVCLDLGSDNGVISYKLRALGGTWYSGDLTATVVAQISALVGERVFLFDQQAFPFADATFDVIVVVDMLEHVRDDRAFVEELHRIIRPDGLLIINAPNKKSASPLRALRHAIGQTDEAHGHLRSGYSIGDLKNITAGKFTIERSHSYSRFFAELTDTAIVWAYGVLSGKQYGEGAADDSGISKGLVVDEVTLRKYAKNFRLYSLLYPAIALFSKLDLLIPFIPGFIRLTVLRPISKS